jgi:hypothetical protein
MFFFETRQRSRLRLARRRRERESLSRIDVNDERALRRAIDESLEKQGVAALRRGQRAHRAQAFRRMLSRPTVKTFLRAHVSRIARRMPNLRSIIR